MSFEHVKFDLSMCCPRREQTVGCKSLASRKEGLAEESNFSAFSAARILKTLKGVEVTKRKSVCEKQKKSED